MSTMIALPAGQEKILGAIKTLWERGYPPSVAEIAEATGKTHTYAIRKQLQALEKKKIISMVKGQHRSIRIL